MSPEALLPALAASGVETGAQGGLTGRVRLYFTRTNETAPYEADSDDQSTAQVFGLDAEDWLPGEEHSLVVDKGVFGYPRTSLVDLEDGTYFAQAELFLYTSYNRQGLPEVWLPATCVSAGGLNGEYAKPDGTLFSAVVQVEVRKGSREQVRLSMDRVTPKAESPGCAGLGDGVDSDWIKTVRVRSSLLSDWWGRDITLEACVLLPEGFDDHPDARYPLVVAQGHYSPEFWPGGAFQETDPACDPAVDGYDCVSEQYAYQLYKDWTATAPGSPFSGARMLVATVNHPVPLFDDSYAVNSANLGPYGDAIVTELIPAVERQYRGVGQGWARGLYGGSTGGWESIGVQVLYPDEFNSAYAACPDPVTFTSYTSINIYEEGNAYFYDSPFKRTERPGQRDDYSGLIWPGYGHPYGQTTATVKEMNHRELVLGTKSRSCGQWDIWEAVFGPVCADGFPCRLYNKMTGEINATVANYWRRNFDLKAIMERDWATLGPKLQGKLHVFVGGSDTYYLTNAVMDLEDFLLNTTNPVSDAEVVIGVHNGRGFEHCFRGYEVDADGNVLPNSLTRLTYNQAFLPAMADHFATSAPKGADTTSWRY